jgi:NADH:ubiquinone reductase (H+-translocating)
VVKQGLGFMTTDAQQKHVVIIGGGFGGLRAARALERTSVQITLIDRENHHLFQPLLYQVATAALSPGNISVPIRAIFRRRSNVRVLLGEVVGADVHGRRVLLENGDTIPYDYLVVAAGTKTNYFGHDEWAEHAHGLKTVRDGIRIRERILLTFEQAEREADPERRRQLLTFVVIGGGPTGVEMAGAISELGRRVLARDYRSIHAEDVRVVLLEMADRVLLPFDERLSAEAQRHLEALGVEVRTGARVTAIGADGIHIGDDEVLQASMVCWAPGVRPVSLSRKLGLPVDDRDRIEVDDRCAVAGHPEVFAIGDIAAFKPAPDAPPLPQLAPVAMQQGTHVGRTIRRELAGKERTPFRYRDKGIMATVGRSRAVVEAGKLRMSGFMAWLAWLFVHILYLVNFQNRMMVLSEWFWAYLTFRPGARLITVRHLPPSTEASEPAGVPVPVEGRESAAAARAVSEGPEGGGRAEDGRGGEGDGARHDPRHSSA